MEPDWQQLLEIAENEVTETWDALPPAVREDAKRISIAYDARTEDSDAGITEDILGHFIGNSIEGFELGIPQLPGQIVLYLKNIWDYAEHDLGCYRQEIRSTLLHELGHYLGLDELDLDDRGLG